MKHNVSMTQSTFPIELNRFLVLSHSVVLKLQFLMLYTCKICYVQMPTVTL